jgi:hypothetical protein
MSEREAERQGVKTRIAKLPMSAVLRAQATGETEGFMKALVVENGDRILGFTMIGAQAGEVMAVVHTAMMADLPYTNSETPTSRIRPWLRGWASCSRTPRLGPGNEASALVLEPIAMGGLFGAIAAYRHAAPTPPPPPDAVGEDESAAVSLARPDVSEVLVTHASRQRLADRQQ